jgi:TonB family protein
MTPIALLFVLAAEPVPLPSGPVPAVRPRADLGALFRAAGYPRAAAQRGEQGDVGFRLVIDPEGRVSRCDVTQSSGSQRLDEATCRTLLHDARFTPARDPAGTPVADVVVSRVRWTLPPGVGLATYIGSGDYPREAIRRREQGRVEFELTISPEGLPTACRILASSGSPTLDEATCRIMGERPRFTPAHDAEGHPTSDTVRSAVVWVLPGPPLIPLGAIRNDPRVPR